MYSACLDAPEAVGDPERGLVRSGTAEDRGVHLGRWLSSVLFERVFRGQFGMGEPKADTVKEALGFIEKQAAVVDARLGDSAYLAGDTLSIADLFAFAYLESTEASDISLTPYPNLAKWYQGIKASPAVKRARTKLFG